MHTYVHELSDICRLSVSDYRTVKKIQARLFLSVFELSFKLCKA